MRYLLLSVLVVSLVIGLSFDQAVYSMTTGPDGEPVVDLYNPRAIDNSGNSVTQSLVDQQIQLAAEMRNKYNNTIDFAFVVQVQDASGDTVSLSYLTSILWSGQSLTVAQSWTPKVIGSYTVTIYVEDPGCEGLPGEWRNCTIHRQIDTPLDHEDLEDLATPVTFEISVAIENDMSDYTGDVTQ